MDTASNMPSTIQPHGPAFPPNTDESTESGRPRRGRHDVTYDELVIAACVAELLHHAQRRAQRSNFAVFGRWTSDGRLLHGRNLDWTVGKGASCRHLYLAARAAFLMMLAYAG